MIKSQRKTYMRKYYRKNKLKIKHDTKIWATNNRVQKVKGTREWRANNKTRVKEHNLRYRYGISLAQYNFMLKSQNNKCFLCFRKTKLGIDHDHVTGRIRGLLCQLCNYALSFFDNKVLHRKIVQYLNQETNS